MAEFFKFGDLNSAMLNLKGDLFFSLKNRSTVSIWVLFFFFYDMCCFLLCHQTEKFIRILSSENQVYFLFSTMQ